MTNKTNIWLDIPGREDPYGSFACFWYNEIQHLVPANIMRLYLSLTGPAKLTWYFDGVEVGTEQVAAGESRHELKPFEPLRAGTATVKISYDSVDQKPGKEHERSFKFVTASNYGSEKYRLEAEEVRRKTRLERRNQLKKSCRAPKPGESYDDLIKDELQKAKAKALATATLFDDLSLMMRTLADATNLDDDEILLQEKKIEDAVLKARAALQNVRPHHLRANFYREEKEAQA